MPGKPPFDGLRARPVGYLIQHTDSGRCGEEGLLYDYVLAGNGLFVEASSPFLSGRVQVAEAEIRGLAYLAPELTLMHGRIPQRLWDLALSLMLVDPDIERLACVVWEDGGYQLRVPPQERNAGHVEYERLGNVVLDLHSHGLFQAFFSSTDNSDEQGFRLYGVVGELRERSQVKLRLGIYGYFQPVKWAEVFDGRLDILEGEDCALPDCA